MKTAIRLKVTELLTDKDTISIADIISSEEVTASRQYVNTVLKEMISEGLIYSSGKGRHTVYRLSHFGEQIIHVELKRTSKLSEDQVFSELEEKNQWIETLPNNVYRILKFVFTEVLNNAIDHSSARKIAVTLGMDKQLGRLSLQIDDDGVGIFEHIRSKFNLETERIAAERVMQGKTTTDPENHTGQGLFFSTKLADTITITSNKTRLTIANDANSQTITDIVQSDRGTQVDFILSLDTTNSTRKIFAEFTPEEDDFEFSTTKITVQLYKATPNPVSRSEAKRLLMTLEEKYSHIILDFARVDEIGQGFADQIFRIFERDNPNITVSYINANPLVAEMIQATRG